MNPKTAQHTATPLHSTSNVWTPETVATEMEYPASVQRFCDLLNAHEELLGLVKELHQVEISSGAREHFADCSICEAIARAEAQL